MRYRFAVRLFGLLGLLLLFGAPATADQQSLSDVLWIDVRSADEYVTGHVDGAINIPHDQIAERIIDVETNRDARIIVYCRSGARAGMARDALVDKGYTNVMNAGGLEQAQQLKAQSK